MTSEDRAAFEHYDDAANREPAAGEARRLGARTLNRHIAVRFPAETIESVRPLAQSEGMTVSAWIRRAVESAVHRQQRE